MKIVKYSEEWFSKLHTAFNSAFKDYFIPFNVSFDDFRNRLNFKLRINSDCSYLAIKNDFVVGFALHTLNYYRGKLMLYNGGTGVVSGFRRSGIASDLLKMLEEDMPNEVEDIVLEVIQENLAAIDLYDKVGFKISRNYRCFKLTDKVSPKSRLPMIRKMKWDPSRYENMRDFDPSFIDSDLQIPSNFQNELLLEAMDQEYCVGYILFQPRNGRITQFGVHREHRKCGIGTNLIAAAQGLSQRRELTIINVPFEEKETCDAVANMGFVNQVKQYEMTLPLK
jgi:ribosomal protein S18 acetylase RimI-like enzyme